nr:retrovirus-related Pol polyprotein from transposon TNT 1-94 [Tanacetum cinerariifolium]
MHNNSQEKKQEVEDHRRNVKLSKNKTSVTACNDSLNAKTLNVKYVSAMCDKCVLHDKHDMCVLKSVAKPIKRTVASESNKKPRNFTRKIYERLIEIVLFIIDSGCSKHMTGNLKLLINFVEKKSTCFIRDLKGNDHLTGSRGMDLYSIILQETNFPNPICLMAKATSSQVWLWHRRLSHLNFDTINLLSKNNIVVGLPKLKFVKDHLCSSCELGKAKRKSFHTKLTPSSKRRLQLLHIDVCGPMRVASINGKRYVLVIVDDYSRYTWTHFLKSKDETTEVLIDFLRLVQRGLQAQVRVVRTDKGTEFLNQTLHAYFATEGIQHQTSIARTPEQNGSRAYRVFNKRTRVIMESIHVNFDELPQMASDQLSSDPAPECQTMAFNHDNLSPAIQRQANVPQADRTVTTSKELDLLFSPMFDELLNGSSKVMYKSSAVSAADDPNQRQQYTTPLNIHTTPAPTCQVQSLAPTKKLHQFDRLDVWELVDRPLCTNVINLKWLWKNKRDEENTVIRNKSCLVAKGYAQQEGVDFEESFAPVARTRRQLESDAEMYMFALTVSRTEPKNIKESMTDSAWIKSMQEELHQFDRLDVWELVN